MSASNIYIWECQSGHRSMWADIAIRSLRVTPRCPISVDGRICDATLRGRVEKMPPIPRDADHG